MAHKFNVNNKNKLDNPKRRELLPPDQTLLCLELDEGDIIADIGCGIGYFSIPASEIVGENGKVYAMDIVPDMLEEVRIKIDENDITNIETVLVEENDFKLENDKVTYAFIGFVLHEAQDKEKFLEEIKRILTIKGKIAIVEWQKIDSKFGPPIEERLEKIELVKILEELNFINISIINIWQDFYGIIAEKGKEEEIESDKLCLSDKINLVTS